MRSRLRRSQVEHASEEETDRQRVGRRDEREEEEEEEAYGG